MPRLMLILALLGLAACTEAEPPEPETVEFVASCLDAIPSATAEKCQCAAESAREAMSEDAYAAFLVSFLPERDARTDALMAQEGFSVDIEAYTMAMLEVMEDCGFGEQGAN